MRGQSSHHWPLTLQFRKKVVLIFSKFVFVNCSDILLLIHKFEFGTVLGTGDMSHSVAGGQYIHNLHRKVSKDDLCYFALSFSLSVATLFSSCVRVYIRPLDFGSTLVNMSPIGIVRISGIDGYLKDLDGPWGWRKLTFIFSSSNWMVHATHHWFWYTHVTNPRICSISSSLPRTVTLSALEVVEDEYILVEGVLLVKGTNESSFRVPGIVRDCWNRSSRRTCSFL